MDIRVNLETSVYVVQIATKASTVANIYAIFAGDKYRNRKCPFLVCLD